MGRRSPILTAGCAWTTSDRTLRPESTGPPAAARPASHPTGPRRAGVDQDRPARHRRSRRACRRARTGQRAMRTSCAGALDSRCSLLPGVATVADGRRARPVGRPGGRPHRRASRRRGRAPRRRDDRAAARPAPGRCRRAGQAMATSTDPNGRRACARQPAQPDTGHQHPAAVRPAAAVTHLARLGRGSPGATRPPPP
jgi:hypothetical protein